MSLKTRLSRLEVRQARAWPKPTPALPEAEPVDMEAFLQAVDSGQTGKVGGLDLDLDAFREFLRDVERMQEMEIAGQQVV